MNFFYILSIKILVVCALKKCLPEMFFLRTQNISLIEKKTDNNHFLEVIYSYVYLPIIRTFDTLK